MELIPRWLRETFYSSVVSGGLGAVGRWAWNYANPPPEPTLLELFIHGGAVWFLLGVTAAMIYGDVRDFFHPTRRMPPDVCLVCWSCGCTVCAPCARLGAHVCCHCMNVTARCCVKGCKFAKRVICGG